MKRIFCAVLALCMLFAGIPALALTGEEALGLVSSDSSEAAVSNYPTLQYGSRDGDDAGAYVVMLQNRLAELGYLFSEADGGYGSLTQNAVVSFQETNGLTPTGIADSTTQSVLYSSSAERAAVQTVANSDTVRVQQALMLWGFMYGYADGVMGETTERGIAEFKNYLNSNPNYAGILAADPTPVPAATLAPGAQPIVQDVPMEDPIIVNGQNGEITPSVIGFADGDHDFEVYQNTVGLGTKGPEVWRVQRRLRQLKYLYKPDGSYGSLTEQAMKYFQQKNGLEETGVADEKTQRVLFSSKAVQSEEYVFPYRIGVSISEQRVYIYKWDGSSYDNEVGSCRCSTGQPGFDTPKGVYQSAGRITNDEWYYFTEYGVYGKYAVRIVGGVLFHSVLYNANMEGPTEASVKNLGTPVSHGCVRLPVENAKWIYDNCAEGTTIVIY